MPSAAPVMMRIKPAVSSSVAFARIFGPTIVNTVESAAKMTVSYTHLTLPTTNEV